MFGLIKRIIDFQANRRRSSSHNTLRNNYLQTVNDLQRQREQTDQMVRDLWGDAEEIAERESVQGATGLRAMVFSVTGMAPFSTESGTVRLPTSEITPLGKAIENEKKILNERKKLINFVKQMKRKGIKIPVNLKDIEGLKEDKKYKNKFDFIKGE